MIEDKHVIIAGYETVRIDDLDKFFEKIHEFCNDTSFVQLFNANVVAGWKHIYLATFNALKAFKNNTNISKNISMEVLLFASGQHQIKKALDTLGVNKSIADIVVLIVADTKKQGEDILQKISEMMNKKPCREILDLTDTKIQNVKSLFGISSNEIKAASREKKNKKATIMNLIAEHMAILSVNHKI